MGIGPHGYGRHFEITSRVKASAGRRWFKTGDYISEDSCRDMVSHIRSRVFRAYRPRGAFEAKRVGNSVRVRMAPK